MGIKPFDIIAGVVVFAILVWYFSGCPYTLNFTRDTGMYFPSSAGMQTEHRGKGVDEPAAQPPTEPKETEPKPTDKPQANPKPEKDTEELAYEVIRGLWACGSERERRMTAAGHDYPTIQQRVNEIIDSMETPEPET